MKDKREGGIKKGRKIKREGGMKKGSQIEREMKDDREN